MLPGLAERLTAGAVTFDDTRYGEHAAARTEALAMRELDGDVRSARIGDEPVDAQQPLAVPR